MENSLYIILLFLLNKSLRAFFYNVIKKLINVELMKVNVYSHISAVKGVGPKLQETLFKCGIFNVMDLLLYFPRNYENLVHRSSIDNYNDEEKIITKCTLISFERDLRTKNGKVITTINFKDENCLFKGRWFNQSYIKNKLCVGNRYILTGKIQRFKGEIIILNPLIKAMESCDEKNVLENKLIPIYALRGNLSSNIMIKLISSILGSTEIEENLPSYLIEKFKFYSLDTAIRNIHNPEDANSLQEAIRRLKFQELFSYSLKVLMLKEYMENVKEGIAFSIAPELNKLKESLPYELTASQSKVIREILIDEKKSRPMNRLVQGDVGSGKTIVAIIALFNVVKNNFQCAMMAPTEILAYQHYEEVKRVLKDFPLNIKILSGSVPVKEKEKIKKELSEGKIDIILGTHALLEEDVIFNNLGMVVTDEQHRFGVMQRSKFFNKGRNIDVLVMTATPIPRTLSLYLYGDLNVSIIDELPPGRMAIETYYMKDSQRAKVYDFALKEINNGRQVYVVCPLVEENDTLELNSVEKQYEYLKENYFGEIRIEILHGKMPPKVKNDIMNEFKNGDIKLLVSTTVIEVGINVPNATLIIVENAERFGLAQLHQLRGRVGRGNYKSYCILIANAKSDTVKKRMEIMKKSNDGFYIAEQDLKIRGGGELLGFKQHGEDNLILCDVIDDIEILKLANLEAKRLLVSMDKNDIEIKNGILKKLEQSSKFICFN